MKMAMTATTVDYGLEESVLEGLVDGNPTTCLLDTGASDNFVSEKLVRKFCLNWNKN